MKNRLKAKIKRKYEQRMRIYEMYILCKAYEMYHMMQLHTACSKESLSYKEAEDFSGLMNEIFNAKTNAETFISDTNEEANQAIEFYRKFEEILHGMEPVVQESILSFCKSVYFGGNCMGLRIDGFIFYPLYLEALIVYVGGLGDFRKVKDAIVDFKPWYDKPRKTDSRKFRRDFIKIEQLYNEILVKKKNRLGKKNVFSL